MMANDVNDSKLIKKSQSIAYHFVKEGIATDEWNDLYKYKWPSCRFIAKATAYRRNEETHICKKCV